jgi:pyrroline-5-carboxylate reductase
LRNIQIDFAVANPWPGVTWANDAADLCARSDILILATRPEDFPPKGFDGAGKLVISFMTAWSLDRLAALCPGARVVRTMPNGAATEGRSFTPWVAGPGLSDADAALVRRLLAVMGEDAQVESEAQLDYLSALSGSGSAYPALMAQAMLADALGRGLPQAVAERAVASVLASGGALAADLQTYLDYRGVTAAGMQAALAAGLAKAITDALAAAAAKARALTERGIGG